MSVDELHGGAAHHTEFVPHGEGIPSPAVVVLVVVISAILFVVTLRKLATQEREQQEQKSR